MPKFTENFGVPNSQKIFGSAISWKFWDRKYLLIFRCILRSKFSGDFGTRNASSRNYIKYQISRKFWNGASKFSRNFSGNLIDMKFTEKFGRGALGLYSKILRKSRIDTRSKNRIRYIEICRINDLML